MCAIIAGNYFRQTGETKPLKMREAEFLILGRGLAGTCLALRLAMQGRSFRILASAQTASASSKAAGLMNPVTGRRMALTWNFAEVWPEAVNFYAEAYLLLTGKPGSFLQKRKIRKVLHSTEEMNFLEAKSAWAGYGDLVKITPADPESSIHQQQCGWAEIDAGYRLDVPVFLRLALEYFQQKNQVIEAEFFPEMLHPSEAGWEIDGRNYAFVILCLGLGCPWIGPDLWAVKGQVFVLRGLPDWGSEVRKTEHFLIPVDDNLVLAGSTYEREFDHLLPDSRGLEIILDSLKPEIKAKVQIETSWAGLRPTSKDRRPVIQEVQPQLYAINGLGTKGVSLAPFAAGQLLSILPASLESTH